MYNRRSEPLGGRATLPAMVETGKRVRLVSVRGGQELNGHLVSLGLVPGVEIEVDLSSPNGTFVISIKGNHIMLDFGTVHRLMVA